MEHAMRIFELDDSLVVRLPETLVQKMSLRDGDELAIVESSKEKVVVEKVDRRVRFLKDMEQFRWPVAKGYKFDRDEANER
jgi:antitoxin component of MazEF toxin-antitoxin module